MSFNWICYFKSYSTLTLNFLSFLQYLLTTPFSWLRTIPYPTPHQISSFAAMVLTNWHNTGHTYDGSKTSMWMLIIGQWTFLLLYFRMLYVAYNNERDEWMHMIEYIDTHRCAYTCTSTLKQSLTSSSFIFQCTLNLLCTF